MTVFKEIEVGELFEARNGKAVFVRDYIDHHEGPYPVYSASLSQPFGLVDSFDYDGDYLTWVMNGYGGRIQRLRGKFSANRDRGVLVPRANVRIPSLDYLRFALEPLFVEHAVGRRVDGLLNEYTKLYPPVAKEIRVPLPVCDDGNLDYATMDRLGDRLARLEVARDRVSTLASDFLKAELAFQTTDRTSRVGMDDKSKFRLSIGQRLLKKNVGPASRQNKVPVYSANVRVPFGTVDDASGLSFDHPSLIWGIDGTFDWNLIPPGEPFMPTDHCGRAEILDDSLDPEFLLYALRARRGEAGFDRVFRSNLHNVREQISIQVPLDANGCFDTGTQRELASEHAKLLRAKDEGYGAIQAVLHARLSLATGD